MLRAMWLNEMTIRHRQAGDHKLPLVNSPAFDPSVSTRISETTPGLKDVNTTKRVQGVIQPESDT